MTVVKPFSIRKMRNLNEFSQMMRDHNLDIPVSENLSILHRPVIVGGKMLHNSVAIHPMEGSDAERNGAPGKLTSQRYQGLAKGGAGILWFEACAFTEDGRSGPNQLFLNTDTVEGFSKLTKLVDSTYRLNRNYVPYKVIQLSHAGRYCHNAKGESRPLTAFKNPYLDSFSPGIEIVTDEYLEALEDRLVEAACLAVQAGFDAIDMKMCHNYLLRELLAGFTRPGKYGGSFDNRVRFFVNVIDKIRSKLGNRLDIVVRLNAYDCIPYPYGWGMVQEKDGVMREDLTEPLKLIRLLLGKGIRMFSISTNEPRFAPRGIGYLANFDSKVKVIPYEGTEILLNTTRRLKRLVPEATIIPAGLAWFEQFSAEVGAGGVEQGWFDIAGFGRQAISNPMFVADILERSKTNPQKSCVTCDLCLQYFELGWPAGCYAHNPIYREIIKSSEKI